MNCSAGLFLFVFLSSNVIYSQSKELNYKEFESELATAIQKEQEQKEKVAQEQARIEELKQKLSDTEQRLATEKQLKYSSLGITEQDVGPAFNEISAVKRECESLLGVSVPELKKRSDEISSIEQRIITFKKRPAFKLSEISAVMNDALSTIAKVKESILEADKILEEQQLAELELKKSEELKQSKKSTKVENAGTEIANESAPSAGESYTVRDLPDGRESLYKIAHQVYGDKELWIKIYDANKDEIQKAYELYCKNNPNSKYKQPQDYLVPGMVLQIPK